MYYKIKTSTMPNINMINQVTITPPYVHVKRQLDEYVMYIIVKGEMRLKENGIVYNLRANDMIILSPKHEHMGVEATVCEYYYIHFNAQVYEDDNDEQIKENMRWQRVDSLRKDGTIEKRESEVILPNYFHFSSAIVTLNFISKMGDIISASNDNREYYALKADCMLMELFIDISRAVMSETLFETKQNTTKASKKVFELLNYFNSSYMENISGDSIEELLGCNFDYLNRVFKQATGKTIFNYLNELRITKAKQFLAGGLYSINDVAEMTGFNDAYYFSKVFKKYTGTTPGKFSKLSR